MRHTSSPILICFIYKTLEFLISLISSATASPATLYPLDHIYNSHNPNLPTAILYGCIGTDQFIRFHDLLKGNHRSVNYVLRHSVPLVPGTISIPGYGVELAIKSLEYKTVDDANQNGEFPPKSSRQNSHVR